MLLYALLTSCIIVLTAGHSVPQLQVQDELPSLKWPENYMVELTRTYVKDGLIEDIVAWKTNASSRVDYNNGVEKHIMFKEGIKYKIFPVTTEQAYNKINCFGYGRTTNEEMENDSGLPPLKGKKYVFVGFQLVGGTNASKYEYKADEHTIETTWAVYEKLDNDSLGWTPIRYERKQFNYKSGALKEHTVHEYLHFYAGLKYVKDEVFKISNLDCTVKIQDSNSDSITKNVMFINPEEPEHVDHVFKRLVSSVSKKHLGYKLSINEFADRTPQEMQQRTGLLRRPHGKSGNIPFPYKGATLKAKVDELPETYDMRLLGLISPVKTIGSCASGWAISSTDAVEGALARVNGGRLMSLANQALIDCAWDYGYGCEGGTNTGAYEWMMKHGLPTEEEYGSYTRHNGYCNIRNMTKLYPIRGYTEVTPFSTSSLKVALVNHGPLTVRIHVTDSFYAYSSGIYYEPSCDPGKTNHEVALVGYSEKDGQLFWILKNSFGPTWGINGYMHISAQDNNCGVESKPIYVVI